MADAQIDGAILDAPPGLESSKQIGRVRSNCFLGHLGGVYDSTDAGAGAARAVVRTAEAEGGVSKRLVRGRRRQEPSSWQDSGDRQGATLDGLPSTLSCGSLIDGSPGLDPEVDSLVQQLARGEGEFFDFADNSQPGDGTECVMCKTKFHETALYEGRHEVKVLQCFHSVCAGCLQSLVAGSTGDEFLCPLCSRRTQKMQELHDYLPHFEVLSTIDSEKMAQSDFKCEECVSGSRAESYCEECSMNLCEFCARQHRRAKTTARHTLVPLHASTERQSLVHRAQFCAKHRSFRYEFYCQDCETLVCNQCAREEHQHHSYKLPTAQLIEKHRQRVRDIIEALCNKLLDAQAAQKVLHKKFADAEAACLQARDKISTQFDELQMAAEARCFELLRNLQENSREPTRLLEEEKSRCCTALVDIWRVIDFMEKVNLHGTDIEVLMAKGHIFRDPHSLQQLVDWRKLAQEPPPGLQKGMVAGWASSYEAENTISSLAGFGSLKTNPLEGAHVLQTAADAQTKKWADLFEDPETESLLNSKLLQGVRCMRSFSGGSSSSQADKSLFSEAASQRTSPVKKQELSDEPRPRLRTKDRPGTATDEPLKVELADSAIVASESEDGDAAEPPTPLEPQKVEVPEDEQQAGQEDDALPAETEAAGEEEKKKRRRRRPRGKGGKAATVSEGPS